MLRFAYMLAGSLAVLLMIGLVPILSQDGMGGDDEKGSEGADWEQMWKELHKPGENQKWLAESAGNWEITGKMFQMSPDGTMQEREMKGASTIKMMWDRYMYEEMTTECDGETMKMVGYISYDNSNKEFQAMYISDMGTGMRLFSGQRSEDGKSLTLSGEWVEKGFGGMKIKERVVTTSKSKDEEVMEMYGTYGDMPEMKIMELTYKRKK